MTGDPRFPAGKPPCWNPPAADIDRRTCTSDAFARATDCAGCRYSAPRELDRAAIAALLGEEAARELFPEEPMTDDDIISAILTREGAAYTDHPADRGGPTRYGITAATLSDRRGHSCTAADVAALAEGEAREIYRTQYIQRPGYGGITDGRLRALVVDCAVLHGPDNASRWLQQAAGAVADGVCGPYTVARVNAADPAALYAQILAERIRFIGRLITHDPSQAVFAAGWTNRAATFLAA